MAMKLDDNEGAISEINVVPLVDIILVVLIIFMVTAPMIMKPSINVNLPKAAAGDKTAPSLLNIVIAADGKLSLNGAISDENTISSKALEAVGQNPDVQAIISADKETPHGTVVHIIDIVKVAGVKKFAISIEKSK